LEYYVIHAVVEVGSDKKKGKGKRVKGNPEKSGNLRITNRDENLKDFT